MLPRSRGSTPSTAVPTVVRVSPSSCVAAAVGSTTNVSSGSCASAASPPVADQAGLRSRPGAGSDRPGLHRRRAQRTAGRGHHLPAHTRGLAVPGDRDRPAHPQGCRARDGRPHARRSAALVSARSPARTSHSGHGAPRYQPGRSWSTRSSGTFHYGNCRTHDPRGRRRHSSNGRSTRLAKRVPALLWSSDSAGHPRHRSACQPILRPSTTRQSWTARTRPRAAVPPSRHPDETMCPEPLGVPSGRQISESILVHLWLTRLS